MSIENLNYRGWVIADWSVQHRLLTLTLKRFPEEEAQSAPLHSKISFSAPTHVKFNHMSPGPFAVISEVTVMPEKDRATLYRFICGQEPNSPFVEISAMFHSVIEW